MDKQGFLGRMTDAAKVIYPSEFLVPPRVEKQTESARQFHLRKTERQLVEGFNNQFGPDGRISDCSVGGSMGDHDCFRYVTAQLKEGDYFGWFKISSCTHQIPSRHFDDLGITANYHDLANHPQKRQVLDLIKKQKVDFFTYDNPADFHPQLSERPQAVMDGGMTFGHFLQLDKTGKLNLNWDWAIKREIQKYAATFLNIPETPSDIGDLSSSLSDMLDLREYGGSFRLLDSVINARVQRRAAEFRKDLTKDLTKLIVDESIAPLFLSKITYVEGRAEGTSVAQNRASNAILTTALKLIPQKDGLRVDVTITHKANPNYERFSIGGCHLSGGYPTLNFDNVLNNMAQAVA